MNESCVDCDVDGGDDEDQHVSVDCRDDDPADQWTSERDERVLIDDEDLVLGRVMRLLWSCWSERLCSMMIKKQSIFDGSCLFNSTLEL